MKSPFSIGVHKAGKDNYKVNQGVQIAKVGRGA